MKYTIYILFFLSAIINAQDSIQTSFIKETVFKANDLISIDNFETIYYVNNNVFSKKTANKTITYNNIQLGNLTFANAFNPLKINLFYKDFNTVIILDNRLAEIFKIDFNTLTPYKNVSYVSTGSDNTVWLFNQDLQKLELFDYKSKTIRAQTLPVQSQVLDLKSNYNYCWLLTQKFLYMYNYFGSLVKKIKNEGYTSIVESNENIILKSENALFYLKKDADKPQPIKTSNLLINQFFVTNQTLYIYSHETLQQLQLKIK
ncbi:hypothetical protein SAMN05428642_1011219 [Flaviramulus basaltis]|uniref:Uncharacterized protein n=1 Tax=Flaviramulus basaltis TaxID=369401 RepID=A0A1K2IF32_9FLAO|nr:hypothetical protein [Flaviramulus basaltis]SFZ90896.1 hypothetical protein SAMN05428642_1011219 [Flaviramulus basaltis]